MKGQSLIMFLGLMAADSLPFRYFNEGTGSRKLREAVDQEGGDLRVGDDPYVPKLFSNEWAEQYFNASSTVDNSQGCYPGRGSYVWRIQGFGSNMNNLVNAWVYALAVKKWSNLSLIMMGDQLVWTTCEEESGGRASKGWGCLFQDIPHVCIFKTISDWRYAMEASGSVSEEEVREAIQTRFGFVQQHRKGINEGLNGLGVDHVGAIATITSHLWSFMTPWLRDMVDQVVYSSLRKKIGAEPFIGIHVRRGDLIAVQQAHFIESEGYVKAAKSYFLETNDHSAVDGIKGIWVASNDPTVVYDVRAIVRNYFPNVEEDNVVWGHELILGRPEATQIPTHTILQSLLSFAYLFADLEQLAAAELFVGTFSSNIGRLVYVMREAAGKPRKSTLSLDEPHWRPG